MKCFTCKTPIRKEDSLFFWEMYQGYERPHCSPACQEVTRGKKAVKQENKQNQPSYPSGSLEPDHIRAAREQYARIWNKIQIGKISDPVTVGILNYHLAELGKLLEDYPEPEEESSPDPEPPVDAPTPEPVKRPIVIPYYGRLRSKLSEYPSVVRKAVPMSKFDYQARLEKKGWAR